MYNPVFTYKLYIPVKNFGGRPWLRASAGYPMPKVQAQHPPSPQTLPSLGASILTPLALGVPVPFYLRLEHCSLDRRIVRSSFVFPFRVNAI